MTEFDIAGYLRPGDLVVIGQAVAEPPGLVRQLIAAAESVEGLTAFCGYTLSPAWKEIGPAGPRVLAYAAHGALRSLAAKGMLDVLPWHLSAVEPNIVSGRLPVDVVLLQVGPKDDQGFYNLGATVDYAGIAAERARVVLVEVNPNMPRTRSDRRLPAALVTAEISSSEELAGSPARPANAVERGVAHQVASVIPSGATVQLGASALADEVARELHSRRGLRVRSGLVGDWLVDLYAAGAMAPGPDTSVIGMALGTRRLYDFVGDSDLVRFAPTQDLVDPVAMRACDPYVAVNSAIEVDLSGAINSEVVAGRYVGAVGGQVDFFRATRQSASGLAIVALAATHPSGESRIVPALSGPVTSLKSDIDLVITEWGIADLRAASLAERAARLIAVAAPEHRAALASGPLAFANR
ncbi:acetyl-CoA hydrolase/transferase C-terminal domain-containing protein [Kribbella sp. NPDC051137]|uniref:acetyl-CoA hydrolase/transferase family protein n=1 Tax=Kribbella sp. NPDC051137 TaxID=3155045 RepID=UPI003442A180